VPTNVVRVDNTELGSPETYFGSNRNQYFGNGSSGQAGTQTYTLPQSVQPNTFYLGGSWDIEPEYAQSTGNDTLEYEYQAKNVYLVAGGVNNTSIEVEVTRDGKPLESGTAGKDVVFKNGKSYVEISGNRLYHIVGDTSYGAHTLQFITTQPGLQIYTFTFG
jgi:hypothetical protein